MNAKWCVGTLFIILALLGLAQEPKKASNQQISIQFVDSEAALPTSPEVVLAVITQKLETLGVDTFEIIRNDGTQFSIRYYSNVDVTSVKQFLSDFDQGAFSNEEEFPSERPKEERPEHFNLVVSDFCQQSFDAVSLHGTLNLVHDQKVTRPFNLSPTIFKHGIDFEASILEQLAYRVYNKVALEINNTSQTIPEVRAGPYSYGIS